ncbi:MAG: ABC transporter substrate-binding protein [Desulfotomaculales bacterium]
MRKNILAFLVFALLSLFAVAGCGQKAPQQQGEGAKAEPIILGMPTALGSMEGADCLRAVKLAIKEINAKGGVSVGGVKRPLDVVAMDTREHEAGIPVNDALAALEKLITEKKPAAIVVGAFRSEVLLASMDLIAKYKIPYICTIAMTPEFEKKIEGDYNKYKYMFRMGINSPYFVSAMTNPLAYMQKQFGFKKIYFLYQDVLWARAAADGLSKWAKGNGWEVVGQDAYPTGSSDFSASLTKAKAGGAQIVFPIFDMPQSAVLIKQSKSMEVPALVFGYIAPLGPASAWKTFNGEIEGMVNLENELGPIAVKSVPKSVEFDQNFGKEYGEKARLKMAPHGVGPAYDAVYVLAEAIERANSLDPDKIVAELEKTDKDGVIGKIRFNKNHQVVFGTDPKEAAITPVYQWRSPGVRVPVYPEAVAEGKIELPSTMKK